MKKKELKKNGRARKQPSIPHMGFSTEQLIA